MSECNDKGCHSDHVSCKSHSKESECNCSSECSCGCPIDYSIHLWKEAFMVAMKEVEIEYLKEKIKKQWGATIEKEGDAVLAAMEAQWSAKITAAKACGDLKETITNIYCDSCK